MVHFCGLVVSQLASITTAPTSFGQAREIDFYCLWLEILSCKIVCRVKPGDARGHVGVHFCSNPSLFASTCAVKSHPTMNNSHLHLITPRNRRANLCSETCQVYQ